MSNYSRRTFIKTATGVVLGAGLAEFGSHGLAAKEASPWTISVRDTHLKAMGKPDCWSALKTMGASGVEVSVNLDLTCSQLFHPAQKYSLASAAEMQKLTDDMAANGMVITSLLMSNQLETRLEREVEWAKLMVKAAQKLKVNAIRIDVVPQKMSPEEFLPFAIKACKQLCALVEGTPVKFGIENHGRVTNDPVFLDKLFDGVGSANLGLTLDACNFYWFGHPLADLYPIFEKFAARAFHTHCKNIRYPEAQRNVRRAIGWEYGKYTCPLYDGDIDYKKVVAILRKANYQGDLCLENECLGLFPEAQHPGILQKEIAYLKRLV